MDPLQINAWAVRIRSRFNVYSDVQGLLKTLPPRGFQPNTSRMPRFTVSSDVQGLLKTLPPRGFEPNTSHMPRFTVSSDVQGLHKIVPPIVFESSILLVRDHLSICLFVGISGSKI